MGGIDVKHQMKEMGLTFPTLVVDTRDLTRDEWLEWRKGGIGGSDAGAIMGWSPWDSPYSVWANKTGIDFMEKEQTQAMRMGNLLEPIVADLFQKDTGNTVIELPAILAHPEKPWMLANVDRFVLDDTGSLCLLECKTAKDARKWTDGVPLNYLAQVMHYLVVTGLQKAWVAVLIGGSDFRIFEVERDEMMAALLEQREEEFWGFVTSKTPPDLDGSEVTHSLVRKMHAASAGEEADITHIAGLITEREEAKIALAEATERVRGLESRIMDALGNAEVGLVCGVPQVTWKAQTRNSLDAKSLKEAHPDIVQEFTKSSTFRVLRFK